MPLQYYIQYLIAFLNTIPRDNSVVHALVQFRCHSRFSGLTGKRLVAYRSETAGHVAILKADVAWNVHHMEKLIVPIPLQ